MPWTNNKQARKKTRKANTPKKQKRWRSIANSVLSRGGSEGAAIRIASGVIKKSGRKKKRGRSRS